MNKPIAIAAIAILAGACKKAYACECITKEDRDEIGRSTVTFAARK